MSIWRLVKREIAHNKFGFITGLISLAAATAGFAGLLIILRAHDAATEKMVVLAEKELRAEMVEQEDYYRRIMRDMGHNVLIVNSEQDMAEFSKLGYPTTYMDYEDVWKLARGGIDTLNHLLPILQEKIYWEEEGMEIMLAGIRGQVPNFAKPEFLTDEDEYRSPITERVPEGKADLGYAVAAALNSGAGERITIQGEEFEVNRIYPGRGTADDLTVWIPLEKAQAILGREGKINGILALECICDLDELGKITRQVTDILPHAQVFEFSSLIKTRFNVRRRADEAHGRVVRSIMAQRAALRGEKERFAAIVIPLLIAGAAVWIFVLVFNDVRERRPEIGILRAVGYSRSAVLKIFLTKALIMGVAGGLAGSLLGLFIGMRRGWAEFPGGGFLAAVDFRVLLAGLLLAPALSFAAGLIPSVLAANQDPADILREG